jgi:hypothetical protein
MREEVAMQSPTFAVGGDGRTVAPILWKEVVGSID